MHDDLERRKPSFSEGAARSVGMMREMREGDQQGVCAEGPGSPALGFRRPVGV